MITPTTTKTCSFHDEGARYIVNQGNEHAMSALEKIKNSHPGDTIALSDKEWCALAEGEVLAI